MSPHLTNLVQPGAVLRKHKQNTFTESEVKSSNKEEDNKSIRSLTWKGHPVKISGDRNEDLEEGCFNEHQEGTYLKEKKTNKNIKGNSQMEFEIIDIDKKIELSSYSI